MNDDEECVCADRVKDDEYYHCPICDAEWFPEGESQADQASQPASSEERSDIESNHDETPA